jgi:1-acyl-sn-glycerol-3-phosphate acyltransferase
MFVDAMVMMVTCDRPVRFLIAGVSYRNWLIGGFAKMMGAIPIERQQDAKVKGEGRIEQLDYGKGNIRGSNTKFS